ncbi:cysteine desulfurase family protein [Robiginitalea sp. M366]|uniref:cysteine desulfurase family protein n=1 Tax=Robiginitalea aestuariiviva TaxID=3036903 RepID=UPI00240DEF6B|nr:cysteine desulfurase family protein [Robiginitalea aestuariiviva]MDG1572420.1 cysteine desulfurase family protein [Robiginitalea aestuariiviva]
MPNIYLDNAATTPIREAVVACMSKALTECYGNPSSTHAFGRSARTGIEQARKAIAARLGAKPGEIIFTSGGTEADNMILRCAVRDLGIRTLITSRIEHHAVLHTAEALARETGIRLEFVPLDGSGNPDMDALEALLKADTSRKLVSLMHVNNEIGNMIDVQAVGQLCRDHEALFHSDTVQSIGHFPWDFSQTPIDFATAAAHKFHGPKGVGFAYIRRNTGLGGLILGGAQERGFRAGTEAYHNIMGLLTAFEAAYDNLEEERQYVAGLKQYLVEQLRQAIPGVAFNGLSGEAEGSTYTLVNVRLPLSESQGQLLLFHLDLKGIACSKGSACQSGADSGSHVLNEILDEDQRRQPSLRLSLSHYNTREEIDTAVAVLKGFTENPQV